jgi:hypothetical protein
MFAASDPNLMVGGFAICGLVLYALWGLIEWVRRSPVSPDPWDAQVDLNTNEAQEICPHCSTPQPPTAWFCEHCGRAVGPYNNLMPYLQVFSEGEVFRNGTNDRMRKSPLIVIGYFLISFNFLIMVITAASISILLSFALLLCMVSFWFALLKNINRSDQESNDLQS